MQSFSKKLRQQSTDAENYLWFQLRARRFHGYKFRRQHPIEHFIVDFICLEKNLVIELDGSQHSDVANYDEERSKILKKRGFRVIRFWNHDVLQGINMVLSVIRKHLVE